MSHPVSSDAPSHETIIPFLLEPEHNYHILSMSMAMVMVMVIKNVMVMVMLTV